MATGWPCSPGSSGPGRRWSRSSPSMWRGCDGLQQFGTGVHGCARAAADRGRVEGCPFAAGHPAAHRLRGGRPEQRTARHPVCLGLGAQYAEGGCAGCSEGGGTGVGQGGGIACGFDAGDRRLARLAGGGGAAGEREGG